MEVRLPWGFILVVVVCSSLTEAARRRIPKFMRPESRGPNVCAVQEVYGTRQRFYSDCWNYKDSKVCGKPTFIRYYCCSGFTIVDGEPGCSGVRPLEDVVYTARNNLLSEFVQYAEAADLTDQLSNEGAFTVFIPQDEAFDKLSDTERKQIVPPRASGKTSPILYHMVNGKHDFKDFKRNKEYTTLYEDKKIRVNKYANGITTVNCARIVRPNQHATNGVVHIVDRVLKPLDEVGNILDVVMSDDQDRFTEFTNALIISGLANKLKEEGGTYTVFAPTDKAFSHLPAGYMQKLLNEDDHRALKALLKNHMTHKPLCADSIYTTCGLRTLEGSILRANCDENGLTVGGGRIKERDMLATNGIVHVTDTLLIPDAAKDLTMKASELGLNQFMNFTKEAGFLESLKNTDEEFTLFAPTDDAFKALPGQHLAALRVQPKAMEEVIKYHIAKGKLTSDSFISQQSVDTESSISAKIKISVYRKSLAVNDAKITKADNTCNNGVIHMIDKVMLPPENDLLDMIRTDPDLSTFYSAIETAGISSMLADSDRLTVLAPTNAAFDSMDRSDLESLMLDTSQLEKVLRNHFVNRIIVSCGFVPNSVYSIRSNQGELLHIKRSDSDITVKTDTIKTEANVEETESLATNGALYKVDQVLPCLCKT